MPKLPLNLSNYGGALVENLQSKKHLQVSHPICNTYFTSMRFLYLIMVPMAAIAPLCIFVCMCVYIYVYVFVCVYMYVCVCVCVYVYV